jgi:2-C-methyl-D-erythritol 4-phosphate cytidylyltransferase
MNDRIHAIVPAGGRGQRFGGPVPKQYLEVAGRPVLSHVLARFLQAVEIDFIAVPIAKSDVRFEELVEARDPRVLSAEGGTERALSVLAGITTLRAAGAGPSDWILVHDAARPLLTTGEIFGLIEAIETPGCPGVVLAVPAADTLKRVDVLARTDEAADGAIGSTLVRDGIWHAMTPQAFRLSDLEHAIERALAAGHPVTDESSALEAMGTQPWLVRGRRSNIKLTYPEDIELVDAILRQRAK